MTGVPVDDLVGVEMDGWRNVYNKSDSGGTGREDVPTVPKGVAKQSGRRGVPHPEEKLHTATVLFVEQSRGGSLAKCLKDVVGRLSPMLGFNIKVEEKAGTKLQNLLSNKNLWTGSECGRHEKTRGHADAVCGNFLII